MPAPTLSDLSYTKTYDDLQVFDEADLDASLNSIQTYTNDTIKDNLVQLAKDAFGITDYQFDSDGNAQYTANLFDKQYATDSYNGGDISITTTADAAYADVDAVSASIAFTPEKTGQYKVTFEFNHVTQSTATTEFQCETTFRITDGSTASFAKFSGGHIPATAAGSGRIANPITISHIFTMTAAVAKTITLQKFNRTMSNVNSNVVSASAATGEIYMTVEKL